MRRPSCGGFHAAGLLARAVSRRRAGLGFVGMGLVDQAFNTLIKRTNVFSNFFKK